MSAALPPLVVGAVSMQVARRERELGIRLVDRSGRVIGLSRSRRALLPLARRVLDEVNQTRRLASHNALVEGERAPGVAVRSFADLLASARFSLAWLVGDSAPSVPPFVSAVRPLRDSWACDA